jgi:hypothetical protein
MQAIGSLAIPILRHSFEINNWHEQEIQKLDRKTRNMLNHPWTASSKSRH